MVDKPKFTKKMLAEFANDLGHKYIDTGSSITWLIARKLKDLGFKDVRVGAFSWSAKADKEKRLYGEVPKWYRTLLEQGLNRRYPRITGYKLARAIRKARMKG